MKCTNCDRPLVPGARFCGKCGTLAPQPVSKPPTAKSINITSDEPDDLPSAPSMHHNDIMPIKHAALAAPKTPHLLEGPHPALLKARHHRDKPHQDETVLTDAPYIPESNPDLEPLEEAPVAEADKPRPETHDTSKAVRTDIPGPRYPFGQQMSDKNYFTTFLLSFFLGVFGADRFYTGQYAVAVLKLLTFGGFTLWAYVDALLLLANLRRDRYGRRLWGRNKDFRASLWIFISFSIIGLVIFGFVMTAAIGSIPEDYYAQ